MKKVCFLLCFFVMFIPVVVHADYSAVIEADVYLTGDDLANHKFSFELTDLDGNVIDVAENDGTKVKFDEIIYHDEDVGKRFYYVISEVNSKENGVHYDSNKAYASVFIPTDNDIPEINYVKMGTYGNQKPNPFRASEEELQGEAYAKFDTESGVATFFRDYDGEYDEYLENPNDYFYLDDERKIIVFKGFEDKNINQMGYSWIRTSTITNSVRKIVFQDPIKPVSIKDWFQYMDNLEEIDFSKLDTSLVEDFSDFLSDHRNLKKANLSSLDTSNGKHFDRAFMYTGLEELDMRLFDFSSVQDDPTQRSVFPSFANGMNQLKYLNISNFGYFDSSAEFSQLPCLEVVVLNNTYKFLYATLANLSTNNEFLKLDDMKLYKNTEIKIPADQDVGTIGGTYIRPSCTKNIAFYNQYVETEEVLITNPETGSKVFILFILLFISFGIGYYFYKQKNLDF